MEWGFGVACNSKIKIVPNDRASVNIILEHLMHQHPVHILIILMHVHNFWIANNINNIEDSQQI